MLETFARENLRQAQQIQAQQYNKGARLQSFEHVDRVLILLPSTESKPLAKWQGPFEVTQQIGPVDYEVQLPGRRHETCT